MITRFVRGLVNGLLMFGLSVFIATVVCLTILSILGGGALSVVITSLLVVNVIFGIYYEIKGGDDRSEYENTTQE